MAARGNSLAAETVLRRLGKAISTMFSFSFFFWGRPGGENLKTVLGWRQKYEEYGYPVCEIFTTHHFLFSFYKLLIISSIFRNPSSSVKFHQNSQNTLKKRKTKSPPSQSRTQETKTKTKNATYTPPHHPFKPLLRGRPRGAGTKASRTPPSRPPGSRIAALQEPTQLPPLPRDMCSPRHSRVSRSLL